MSDEIKQAKENAQRRFSLFAADMLRTIAGRQHAVYGLRHRLANFIDAQKTLNDLRGSELTPDEEREALELPPLDRASIDPRGIMFETGTWMILQGALRLAAHQILGERPHFGGKYSKELITQGIKFREPVQSPAQSQAPSKERKRAWGERLGTTTKPSVRRKRRSSSDAGAKEDPDAENR